MKINTRILWLAISFIGWISFGSFKLNIASPSINIITPTIGQKISNGVDLEVSVAVSSDRPLKSVIFFFDSNGDGIEEVQEGVFNASANVYQATFSNLGGTGKRTLQVHATDNYLQTAIASRKIEVIVGTFEATRITSYFEDILGIGEIRSVAYSSDGTKALLGGGNSSPAQPVAFLLDLENRRVLQQFYGHRAQITTVAFSTTTDTIIATGSLDGTAKIWNANNGNLIQDLQFNQFDDFPSTAGVSFGKTVNDLAFSPDGTKLLTANGKIDFGGQANYWAWIWDVSTGDTLRTIRGASNTKHTLQLNAAVWSPTGDSILTCSDDNKVKLWNANNGLLLNTYSSHSQDVNDVVFSSDGAYFLSGDESGDVYETNIASLQVKLFDFGLSQIVHQVAYSFDESKIVVGGINSTTGGVKIWDRITEELVHELKFFPVGSDKDIYGLDVRGDRDEIIAGSEDGKLVVWNIEDSERETFKEEPSNSWFDDLAISPNGNTYVIRHSSKGFAIVSDLDDSSRADTIEFFYTNTNGTQTYKGNIESVEFSPDGSKIITALSPTRNPLNTPVVVAWDANQPNIELERFVLSDASSGLSFPTSIFGQDTKAAKYGDDNGDDIGILLTSKAAFSWGLNDGVIRNYVFFGGTISTTIPMDAADSTNSNNQLLVAKQIFNENKVDIWDLKSEAIIQQNDIADRVGATITEVKFSNNGEKLLIGCQGRRKFIYDLETETNQFFHSAAASVDRQISAFSPDDKYILSARDLISNTATRWELLGLEENRLVRYFNSDVGGARVVGFVPGTSKAMIVGSHVRTFDVFKGARKEAYVFTPESTNRDLAISANNTKLIQATTPGNILLWDIVNKVPIHTADFTFGGSAYNVDLSVDGELAVVTDSDQKAIYYDPENSEIFQLFKDPDAPTNTADYPIDLAPNDAFAAMGFAKKAYNWQLSDGILEQTFDLFSSDVKAIAYSSDNMEIAVGNGTAVRIYDAQSGQVQAQTFDTHTDDVIDVRFSPDGSQLATASEDAFARLWDANVGGIEQFLLEHESGTTRNVSFSSNGSKLLTAHSSGTSYLWETSSGKLLRLLEGQQASNQISSSYASDDLIYTTGEKAPILVFNDGTKTFQNTFGGHTWVMPPGSPVSSGDPAVTAVAISPDGNTIITGGTDRLMFVWDATTAQQTNTLSLAGQYNFPIKLEFDNTGARLIYVDDRGTYLWDAITGEYLGQQFVYPEGTSDPAFCVGAAFSPDASKLITAHDNDVPFNQFGVANGAFNDAVLWDIQGDSILSIFDGHEQGLTSVDFSSDGTKIVTGSKDATARVWDVASQGVTLIIKQEFTVSDVEFSPDGTKILTGEQFSGDNDRFANLWDASNGNLIAKFLHPEGIKRVHFNADGSKILTVAGNTTYVWDVSTGLLDYAVSHVANINDAIFSEDGTILLSGGNDNLAKAWEIGN